MVELRHTYSNRYAIYENGVLLGEILETKNNVPHMYKGTAKELLINTSFGNYKVLSKKQGYNVYSKANLIADIRYGANNTKQMNADKNFCVETSLKLLNIVDSFVSAKKEQKAVRV